MRSDRVTAVVVGGLFITATAGYMVGQAIYGPLIDAPDFLASADGHRTRLIAGVFVELLGIVAIPLIAAFVFPVLKRFGEGLALSYLALRTIEAMLLIVVAVNVLSMADASRGFVENGPLPSAYWEDLVTALQHANQWPFLLSVAVVFPAGSLLLNSVLFTRRLVPRLIAGWGVIAAGLLLMGSVLDLLGAFPNVSRVTLEVVLAGPIAIQEMVLALWLIARGFDAEMLPEEIA